MIHSMIRWYRNAIAFYRHLGFADLERDEGSIVMGLGLG